MQDIDAIKVLNRRDAIRHIGISERTFQRLEVRGEGPPKTRLSEGRVGYRASDIEKWLDVRRETATARESIDSDWKPVSEGAKAVAAKVQP